MNTNQEQRRHRKEGVPVVDDERIHAIWRKLPDARKGLLAHARNSAAVMDRVIHDDLTGIEPGEYAPYSLLFSGHVYVTCGSQPLWVRAAPSDAFWGHVIEGRDIGVLLPSDEVCRIAYTSSELADATFVHGLIWQAGEEETTFNLHHHRALDPTTIRPELYASLGHRLERFQLLGRMVRLGNIEIEMRRER